ncbi:MAG: hypothetical protein RDU25_04150 [Patescibacteria group bacterium]|nr:hypothetical protein [Patescibacteria group bacterium]
MADSLQEKVDRIAEGSPWWRTCSVMAAIGVISCVVLGFVAARLYLGGVVRIMDVLPADFPPGIQLYRTDQAASTILIRGQDKAKLARFMTGPMRLIGLALPISLDGLLDNVLGSREAVEWQNSKLDDLETDASRFNTVILTWDEPLPYEETLKHYMDLFIRQKLDESSMRDSETGTESVFAIGEGVSIKMELAVSLDKTEIENLVMIIDYVPR